jgi:hypothetical protein
MCLCHPSICGFLIRNSAHTAMLLKKVIDKDHVGDPWSFVPIFHSEPTS